MAAEGGARVVLGPGVEALAGRAAWIAATRTLVVADVHLGKGESLAALGAPMPLCMHAPLLARWAQLVISVRAARVVIVGDLLHARAGLTRLLIDEIGAWRREALAGVEVVLIPGNHDRSHAAVASAWDIVVREASVREGHVLFVHDPADVAPQSLLAGDVAICGHVHPVVCVGGLHGSLRAPCFVVDQAAGGGSVVILPALTDFSRGASVGPQVGRRVIAAVDGVLLEFPSRPAS